MMIKCAVALIITYLRQFLDYTVIEFIETLSVYRHCSIIFLCHTDIYKIRILCYFIVIVLYWK